MCGRNRKQQKDAKKLHHLDVESKFLNNPGARRGTRALLMHDTTVSVSTNDAGALYTESFQVRGMSKLIAQSTSIDPKMLKEMKRQKERLQTAGHMDFQQEEKQKEMQIVATSTKKMKEFWVWLTLAHANKEANGHRIEREQERERE